jgi:tellurite resistance protein TehA-like permease
MGTGIVSIILITIPHQASWLYYLSIIFFILNTILFFSAFAVSVLRYTLYPEIWGVMIRDPTNSLFLGTIPMGFATLVNMWIYVCVPAWGSWAATVAWILWMIDAIVAAGVTLSMPVLLYVCLPLILSVIQYCRQSVLFGFSCSILITATMVLDND